MVLLIEFSVVYIIDLKVDYRYPWTMVGFLKLLVLATKSALRPISNRTLK